MANRAALISIQPKYVEKIVNGDKHLEFRRRWTSTPVQRLVIYGSSPIKKIMAVAEIKSVSWGKRETLWNLSKKVGGGVTRQELYEYLEGGRQAAAIEIYSVRTITGGLDPKKIFGQDFVPPQSFKYITEEVYYEIRKLCNKRVPKTILSQSGSRKIKDEQ